MAEAAVEDMRARYELGCLVHGLRYGLADEIKTRALAKFGRMFRVGPATLWQYARVTRVIGREEFQGYLAARGPHGFALTWSHIEELARVRNSVARGRCAEQAVGEALSVGELRVRIPTATSS
jgi:hypothetical protein